MAGVLLRRSKKSGLPPGTPAYVGEEEPLPACITVISYDETSYEERTVENASEIIEDLRSPDITWVNVDGLDAEDIIEIGTHMGFHPLYRRT